MREKIVKTPGPDHPIEIEKSPERVRVTLNGKVIADSVEAFILKEAAYPPAYYIPRDDVDMSRLRSSNQTTYCPYKGDCSYYSGASDGQGNIDVAWSYESAYPAVAVITNYLAFYPDRVDEINLSAKIP